MKKRANQRQLYVDILNEVNECLTEEDLDAVCERADEAVQAGLITKKAYKALLEELDDRCIYLSERGLI